VPLEHVQVGQRLRVRPGERVPVDGMVQEGTTSVDESMITGESIPLKSSRARVTGGTINGTGGIVMVAERVGRDTMLARIVQMVSEAQRSQRRSSVSLMPLRGTLFRWSWLQPSSRRRLGHVGTGAEVGLMRWSMPSRADYRLSLRIGIGGRRCPLWWGPVAEQQPAF